MASQVQSIGRVTMGVANEKELLALAQSQALADAKARAERLAEASNLKVGKVYSISEFNLRGNESYELRPQRFMVAPSDRSQMYALSVGSSGREEPFSPGLIEATARVFVVFLVEK